MAEGAVSREDARAFRAAEQTREQARSKVQRQAANLELDALEAKHAGNTLRLARQLEELTHLESRVTILGYVQRGGTPSAADRLLATRLGTACADLINEGVFGVMVAARGDGTEPVPPGESRRQAQDRAAGSSLGRERAPRRDLPGRLIHCLLLCRALHLAVRKQTSGWPEQPWPVVKAGSGKLTALPRSGPDENQRLLFCRIGPQPDALPGIATVNYANDLHQAGRAAFELQQPVRRLAKPFVVDAVAGLFREVGHVQHVVLNQVIKEVRAE